MAHPETIRVRLSPEDAGAITLSPVVAQDLALAELIEIVVRAAGKDSERVRRILEAGTVLSGATRYRWAGWETTREEVEQLLARFPDPEPERRFAPELCVAAVFEDAIGRRLELPRAVGARRRFLRRRAFWDVLIELARSQPLRYVEYSYQQQADRYRMEVSVETALALRDAARMVPFRTLADRLRRSSLTRVDFYVARGGC
jgi:hypothetical protein